MSKPLRGRRATGRRWVPRILKGLALCVLAWFVFCLTALAALRWVNPPLTVVHLQRRLEALVRGERYNKRYTFVPLARISPHLQHAVIAAEDGRFYLHQGIDWEEIRKAWREEVPRGRIRGVSTITQQVVKNLFLTTYPVRKPLEFLLAPAAERILPKARLLELYLNIVEWGRGIYGAEEAARYYYRTSAARLSREQAARLAACLPAPRSRHPERMDSYSAEILERMSRMGW